MPTTAETINYNSFLTTTIKNYSKKMVGQYLVRRPAVALFFDEYRHTDTNGGRTWQGMVDYGQSTTAQFFAGADTFSTTPQEVAQPIRYDWKYLGGSVSITKTEQLENSGPVALASLLDTRMKQLNRTFDLVIGNEIFSDGTNFGGKSIVGLAAAVSTTPTSGVVGGLDPSVWGFWQNNAATSFGSFAANGPNGTADSWITNWNNCTDGDVKPDFTLSSQNCWEFYHKTTNSPVRFVRPGPQGNVADLTWESLEYMGRPWYWDRQCPAGRAYFIRKDDTHMVVDPRFLFEWTGPLTYPDQMAFTRLCGVRFFLRTERRMFEAVIDGVTA
jgi:hypothetical protein